MDASPLVFHETFNFHDGNILMSASGSRDGLPTSPVETIHFRLHKSVLSIYSTTFADMLSMPQGDSPVENAVVHLQDPLDHVIKLLTAIYYGGSVPQQPLSRATWDFLVPVLTLADKYDMGTLGANLLPRLLEDWPTTLGKWDDVDARSNSIARDAAQRRRRNSSLPAPNDLLPEPAIAIKFGQTNPAARNILPTAFYHLSRLSHSLADEVGHSLYYSELVRFADDRLLASEDLMRVLRGQANIREWLNGVANRIHLSTSCPRRTYPEREDMEDADYDYDEEEGTPNPCRGWQWWNTHVKSSVLEIGTKRGVDVLAGLKTVRDTVEKSYARLTSEDELCYDCHVTFVQGFDASRREFWKRLPSFFRLEDYPNWGKS